MIKDLTGIEDTAICRALLESQNWDLELTAREHFGIQSEPNNENDPSPQRTNQAEQPQVNLHYFQSEGRTLHESYKRNKQLLKKYC